MSDSDDVITGFDQTNGEAGDLEGESGGTAAGDDYSGGDRGVSVPDQDDYVGETVQEELGNEPTDEEYDVDQQDVDPVSSTPSDNVGGFHTGD